MRLYKYMSLAGLESVLEHQSLGFSRPADLNDPFDFPTGPDVLDYGVFGSLTASLKGSTWARYMGVCSLTRTFNNSLMWAHYGDGHKGAVIEIDCEQAGFMSTAANAVPAHFGSVIYLNQPNMEQYAPLSESTAPVTVGELFHFRLDYYQQLQRLFLSKPLCWAYEEEVRVVKCLRGVADDGGENESGNFTLVDRASGGRMHAYHLPENSITGVFFGMKVPTYDVHRLIDAFDLKDCHTCGKERGSYEVQVAPYGPKNADPPPRR